MKLLITVEGRQYEVEVQVLDGTAAAPMAGSAPVTPAVSAPAAPRPAPPAPAPAPASRSAPAPAPAPAAASGGGVKLVKAPIVGTVVKVLVKPGDAVARNQPVIVMEAMKMETNVSATDAGIVKAVRVGPGQAVKSGDVLVELQ